MKAAFPVQVAQYAVAHNLQNELAFRWLVSKILRCKGHIIKVMKTRYLKKTHKYGIRIPHSVEEAYQLDAETDTDYWTKAIIKEMKNNAIAFKFLDVDESIPIGSKWIPCHMIFDV